MGHALERAEPGIQWEAGEEDYPFPALPGESALDYFRRWLDTAAYARVDQVGIRYIHEEDVANLFNHVTADIDLLRTRLGEFGDLLISATEHEAMVRRLEAAIEGLRDTLDMLQTPPDR